MKVAAAISAALYWMIAGSVSYAATVRFPGHTHIATSPDGNTMIVNIDRDEEPNHVLSLKDKGRSRSRAVLSYGRYVDVSWSPDSKFFFVNDYDGSDVARCVLLDRAHLNKRDTRVLLQKEMDAITAHFKGSSWTVTCSSWQKGDKVRVSIVVSGNGTVEEVRKRFLLDARTGAFTAKD